MADDVTLFNRLLETLIQNREEDKEYQDSMFELYAIQTEHLENIEKYLKPKKDDKFRQEETSNIYKPIFDRLDRIESTKDKDSILGSELAKTALKAAAIAPVLEPLTRTVISLRVLPGIIKTLKSTLLGTINVLGKFIPKNIRDIFKNLKTSILTNAKNIFSNLKTQLPKSFQKIINNLLGWFKAGKTTFLSKISSMFKVVSELGFVRLLKKIATPLTLFYETLDGIRLFSGDFKANVAKITETVSEKGLLGRAFYGFTHWVNSIVSAGSLLYDTFTQGKNTLESFTIGVKALIGEDLVNSITSFRDNTILAANMIVEDIEWVLNRLKSIPILSKYFTNTSDYQQDTDLTENDKLYRTNLIKQIQKLSIDKQSEDVYKGKSIKQLEQTLELLNKSMKQSFSPQGTKQLEIERSLFFNKEGRLLNKNLDKQQKTYEEMLKELRKSNELNQKLLEKNNNNIITNVYSESNSEDRGFLTRQMAR